MADPRWKIYTIKQEKKNTFKKLEPGEERWRANVRGQAREAKCPSYLTKVTGTWPRPAVVGVAGGRLELRVCPADLCGASSQEACSLAFLSLQTYGLEPPVGAAVTWETLYSSDTGFLEYGGATIDLLTFPVTFENCHSGKFSSPKILPSPLVHMP